MICRRVRLENFRNIKSAEVEFDDGVNILVGKNGQGKTNLIEAIGYASYCKSFRGADEGELIRFDSDNAAVSLDFRDSIREQNITLRATRQGRRRVEINKVSISRLSDMVGSFSTVIFCPEHLSIIKDGPAARRMYLDLAVSQLRPVYIAALQKYNKILKQRNQLIRDVRDKDKDGRRTFDRTVDFWSAQLAAEAAVISGMRAEYLRRAGGFVAGFFSEMTGGGEIPSLRYTGSSKDEADFYFDTAGVRERYLRLLSSSHEREIAAGTTLWGIHKDDIEVSLNSRPAREYASQGQQRSLALALKLTEGEIYREDRGEYPVFLLDDVLSELDAGRRDYLINRIGGRQAIITCCESVAEHTRGARVIEVKSGEYTPIELE